MRKHLFFLTAMISSLWAQTVTMQECIEKTLYSHPDIKTFMLEVSKSEQNYQLARSAYLPHIDFEAEYDFRRTFALPQNGKFRTVEEGGWQAGVALRQKVWDFSKTTSLIHSADLQKDIARLSVEEAKNLMIYRVESLYETVVIQKEIIRVRKKDMQAKKELYEQAEAFVEQGLKTTSDSTRFLSAFYAAKDALGAAESSYMKTIATLSLYTAEQIDFEAEFENNLLTEVKDLEKNRKKLKQEMLENNIQLKIYDKTIQKDTLLHRSAKAAHYGSIDAVASYTRFDTLNAYDTGVVGVTLNIPIYTGSQISAQEQISRIETAAAKEAKASKSLALSEELEGLIIDLAQYKNTLQAKHAQLEASLSTKKLLEARYKEGLSTYIEVLDAMSSYLSSKLEILEAYYGIAMAQNRIKYLTGVQK
ncbi:TolC family protein [Sulfurimonas sp. HSL-1716]|uniref:TolC family protein n=1 Tax=Hydrocurvibacter sulfurireducens TaxID=3131937 RepID=UPI0031F94D01